LWGCDDEHWQIDGLFNELIISAEMKMIKTDRRIFHLAVKRLGTQPGETHFIDDVEENVLAAHNEGLVEIRYIDTRQFFDTMGRTLTND